MAVGIIHIKAQMNNPGPCPPGEVPNCPSIDYVFFPHPEDCGWFFRCMDGVAYCMQCPADLHWNTELETCDYPDSAGCDEDGTTVRSICATSVVKSEYVSVLACSSCPDMLDGHAGVQFKGYCRTKKD